MPTPKSTPAERKALAAELRKAKQILALRKAGVPWSDDRMRALVSRAPQGRALLRKHGLAETGKGIAPSYARTDAFRAAEAERRQARAVAAAQPKPKKRTVRARKASAK